MILVVFENRYKNLTYIKIYSQSMPNYNYYSSLFWKAVGYQFYNIK